MANKVADEGKLFVCLACGKTSKDLYGDQKISRGWDESCMLHAEEVDIKHLIYEGDLVVKVRPPSIKASEANTDGESRPK